MKIVFLIGSLKIGGTEKTIVNLVNSFLEEKDCSVIPILYGNSDVLASQISSRVINYTNWVSLVSHYQIFKNLNRIISLVRTRILLSRIEPQIIISLGEVWNNYALIMSTGFRAKKYISDRGDFNNNWPKIHQLLRVLLYNMADKVIIQRTFQLNRYEKFVDIHKLKIIKNHFPESSLKRINEIKDSVQRGNSMVCISRLIPSKRIDRVLSVFSRIAESSNYELVIIGDDDLGFQLKPRYLRFIEEKGISNRVSFLPPNTDVFKILCQSKIFIFGSESEGMPNVLIEALYAGNHVCTFEDFLEIGPDAIESYHVFPTEDVMVEGLLHLIGNDTVVSMDYDFFQALNVHFKTIQLFKEEILKN